MGEQSAIATALARINEIVAGWAGGNEPSPIERDIVLQKLQQIYEAVRFPGEGCMSDPVPIASGQPCSPEDGLPECCRQTRDQVKAAAETIAAMEDESSVRNQSQNPDEMSAQDEPTREESPEERPAAQEESESITIVHESIMDLLYGDDCPVQPAPANEPAAAAPQQSEHPATPVENETPRQKKVLGEVIGGGAHSLNDTIHPHEKDVATSITAGIDLRQAIGVNDRFMLIRELFGGDIFSYEEAIIKLNAFHSIEDALIHIQTTYRWNPENPGTRLIVDMLMKKFG